jgi:hypothetical protein
MPKSNIDKRVKFLYKNDQRIFFEQVMQQIGSRNEVAQVCDMSPHQIGDWKSGKYTVPLDIFERLLLATKIVRPTKIKIIDQYAHTKSAGKKGFEAVIKKYGVFPNNEDRRKRGWQRWWKTIGIHREQKILVRIPIKRPRQSVALAELCGILIGDGGVTPQQMIISLNGETDKPYSEYVMNVLRKLFDTEPKVYERRDSKVVNICISRRDLVDYLHKNGIIVGNKLKQNLSIPSWIMKSKPYITACIRGMVDTDGSVVIETHTIKNKKYTYYRLNFTSASPILIDQTFQSLVELGFTPKIRRGGRSIQLENIAEIWEYFKTIGTSNPKHAQRLGGIG